jgi:hypothetical protein
VARSVIVPVDEYAVVVPLMIAEATSIVFA